jgi:hypothetical protein
MFTVDKKLGVTLFKYYFYTENATLILQDLQEITQILNLIVNVFYFDEKPFNCGFSVKSLRNLIALAHRKLLSTVSLQEKNDTLLLNQQQNMKYL